jgi:hypothetical protein
MIRNALLPVPQTEDLIALQTRQIDGLGHLSNSPSVWTENWI